MDADFHMDRKDEKNSDEEKSLLEKAKEKNSDVYGWIKVDGTKVSYPIVQHKKEDSYYLNHDSEKNTTVYGAIFTEKYNSRNFDDPITLIYGHAVRDGSMFGGLRNFRSKDFFDENRFIYIYFEDKVYVYEIVSAYSVDNEHVFSKYDLTSKEKVEKYYDDIKNQVLRYGGNYREKKYNGNRILILSTCNSSYDDRRFLVQAILVKEEKIK